MTKSKTVQADGAADVAVPETAASDATRIDFNDPALSDAEAVKRNLEQAGQAQPDDTAKD